MTIRFLTDSRLEELREQLPRIAATSGVALRIEKIGSSRAGRDMWGVTIGNGAHRVSITAGAHADEPVGPITAAELAEWLVAGNRRDLTDAFTFSICPQVNPDGSAANEAWFADPIDPARYAALVQREGPGDDIEFGYPGGGKPALRPENQAVADFLQTEGASYVYHASLHGMAYAEGAWYLIGKEWAGRTAGLRTRLVEATHQAGLPLHDIDRRGDKGFSRIAAGFCTTPVSTAMQQHFISEGDPATAELFHFSSMEFVKSLGGDPLVMVSELPLFLVGEGVHDVNAPAPAPGSTAYEQFRAALPKARAHAAKGNKQPLLDLMQHHNLRVLDLATQVQLQKRMVLESLDWLSAEHLH